MATLLQKNQRHLNDAISVLGPYYRMLTAAMGNGRWIDSYICGLFDPKDAPEPAQRRGPRLPTWRWAMKSPTMRFLAIVLGLALVLGGIVTGMKAAARPGHLHRRVRLRGRALRRLRRAGARRPGRQGHQGRAGRREGPGQHGARQG
ncbi:hypothetical protein [Nocardioides convexus]|uniref:hypothetical protein n=1 Tax=Nocardioides convexus TaxID=2712224 RepID=UPI0024189CD4|nr:hypothetical protein [Nocardioides convexus]